MGTVHGVYLKYVGLSCISYAGYTLFAPRNEKDGSVVSLMQLFGSNVLSASAIASYRDHSNATTLILKTVPAFICGYSTILNAVIAILFKLEVGMSLIGKDRQTGQIPLWSQILFFPFHLPTRLYTYLHMKKDKGKVPVASEVLPGWWVGGCYAHQLEKDWSGVIDLTVEFPESTIHRTKQYLSLPTWDGVPASPAQLEQGANFAVAAHANGDVLIHCAHGRGRSTTVMCAALVKAGLYPTWQEALEQGIQPGRPVCKLNRRMRQALTEWQTLYVDGKKEQ